MVTSGADFASALIPDLRVLFALGLRMMLVSSYRNIVKSNYEATKHIR
jgi:hypothetical protein